MPKLITAILVCFFLLFQAGAGAQDFFSEDEETDIVGYDELLFGSRIRDFDTTRMNSLDTGFSKTWIVNEESYDSFVIADKTFTVFTTVYSLDNFNVDAIVIIFDLAGIDIDEVSSYVRMLRNMYISKYNQEPVWDDFVWEDENDYFQSDCWSGVLEIDDSDGDIIWIKWDVNTLFITYRDAEYQQAVWDNAMDAVEEQGNRI